MPQMIKEFESQKPNYKPMKYTGNFANNKRIT